MSTNIAMKTSICTGIINIFGLFQTVTLVMIKIINLRLEE